MCLLRKLNGEQTKCVLLNVTPNKIAGLLIQNAKPKDKGKIKSTRQQVEEENNHLEKALTVEMK